MPLLTNPYDKVLEQKGLKFEDLTEEEQKLYADAERAVKGITPSDLRDHLDEMFYALLLDHCDTPNTPEYSDKNAMEKAKLKVYALLLAFMETPERVARAISRDLEEE